MILIEVAHCTYELVTLYFFYVDISTTHLIIYSTKFYVYLYVFFNFQREMYKNHCYIVEFFKSPKFLFHPGHKKGEDRP